jgi:hypothetical protein
MSVDVERKTDTPVTYPLHVHLAIAGAISLGVLIGEWLLLAVIR